MNREGSDGHHSLYPWAWVEHMVPRLSDERSIEEDWRRKDYFGADIESTLPSLSIAYDKVMSDVSRHAGMGLLMHQIVSDEKPAELAKCSQRAATLRFRLCERNAGDP